MKKILFFVLALVAGFAAFSQSESKIWNFEQGTDQDCLSDDTHNHWALDDYYLARSGYNYIVSYGHTEESPNALFLSAPISLTKQSAKDGAHVMFHLASEKGTPFVEETEDGQPSISEVELWVYMVDGGSSAERHLTTVSVSSDGESPWTTVDINISEFEDLLDDDPIDFRFGVIHTEVQGCDGSVKLDDFIYLRNDSEQFVQFDEDGVMGSIVTRLVSKENFVVPEPTMSRAGYSFDGWLVGMEDYWYLLDPGDELLLDEDIVFIAFWGINYTIAFSPNGGEGVMSSIETHEYKGAILPGSPFTREGYTCIGWSSIPLPDGPVSEENMNYFFPFGEYYDSWEEEVIINEGVITLYAVWIEGDFARYEITFDANGGKGEMAPLFFFEYDDAIVMPECDFYLEGFDFVGWSRTPELQGNPLHPGNEIIPDKDMTFYAIWIEVSNTVTFSFDANGGQGTMPDVEVSEGDEYALPECKFTREGYTFKGWGLSATDANPKQPGFKVYGNMSVTFYAIWEANTTDPNGIDDIMLSSVNVYPNPAQSKVAVSGINADRLDVMDLTGRVVRSVENTNTISLEGIANGVYMLRIQAAEAQTVRKIVKK